MKLSGKSIRICFSVPGIRPGSRMTGAAVDDRNILRELALIGVECHVVIPCGRTLGGEDGNGWALHRVGIPAGPRVAYHTGRIARVSRAVYSVYEQNRFDVLRVHSFFSSSIEMLWTKWRYRLHVPVVAHHYHLDSNPLRRAVVRLAMDHCDALITISQASRRDAVRGLGKAASKIHVVYPGIERSFYPRLINRELLHQLGCSTDERILLYLGSMEIRKNVTFLLEALAEIISVRKKVKLVLCGSGPLMETVRRKSSELGVGSHVVLTGEVPEERKVDYYNLADVFVFASRLEGFGLVMGEAMSCGKPVVALNTSAIPEVVEDGVTGFLVRPGGRTEFVAKICMLLDNNELRLEMGRRAEERVERLFRWERAARETLKVYEETIQQFRSGGV